ncbi:hypothetical protein LXL04_038300 [Taraxacum kok-saghyz]
MINGTFMPLTLLKRCKTLTSVTQLHTHILKAGLDSDSFIAGNLILHCATLISDALHYAHSLLLHSPHPDAFMYNTVIRGFSDSDHPYSSFTTFIDMRRNSNNLQPDSFSFAFSLKAAANLRSYDIGIQLHSQAILHGLHNHLYVGTTLVSMYAECGWISHARNVFDEIPQPNIVAWNALITACIRCSDVKGAESLYKRMPVRDLHSSNIMLSGYMKSGEVHLAHNLFANMPTKDDVSYSTMITGFSHNGHFHEAFNLFQQSHRLGLPPNEVTLTGILSVSTQSGEFQFAQILHCYLQKSGFVSRSIINNTLMDTYFKSGNTTMARSLFQKMPGKKNLVSWTTMVAGTAMQGHGQEAMELFHQMVDSGIKPDSIAFISILYACSHAGLLDHGCKYFSMMTNDYKIEPSYEHYGCMVDLYGRAGELEKAYDFITKMPIEANDVIWRTLLGACWIHGDVELGEEVKKRLLEVDPNDSGDCVLLSNMYASVGKWKDVLGVRKLMKDEKLVKTPGWSIIEQ